MLGGFENSHNFFFKRRNRLSLKRTNPRSISFLLFSKITFFFNFSIFYPREKIFERIEESEKIEMWIPPIFWEFRPFWKAQIRRVFEKYFRNKKLWDFFQTRRLKFYGSFIKRTFRVIKMKISREYKEISLRKYHQSKERQKQSQIRFTCFFNLPKVKCRYNTGAISS